MVSSGLLRRVALVRIDISEEPDASFIRVTKIGELGTTQAATSNRRTLRRKTPFFTVQELAAGQYFYGILLFLQLYSIQLKTLRNSEVSGF
jgi:hypothetical protein